MEGFGGSIQVVVVCWVILIDDQVIIFWCCQFYVDIVVIDVVVGVCFNVGNVFNGVFGYCSIEYFFVEFFIIGDVQGVVAGWEVIDIGNYCFS